MSMSSQVQQQRFAGVVFLLSILIGATIFLVTNISDSDESNSDIMDLVGGEVKTFLDPHNLENGVETLSDSYGVEVNVSVEKSTQAVTDNIKKPALVVVADNATKAEVDEMITLEPVVNDIKLDSAPIKKVEIKKLESVVVAQIPEVKKRPKITEISWFLQLGSFSIESNAKKLQTKVATLGYKSRISTVQVQKGTMYRLRIGPDTNKSALKTKASKLKKTLKLKAQLVRNK